MQTGMVRALASSNDTDLFEELATGIDAVVDNAERIWEDACCLWDQGRKRGYRILMAAAEEEAAKALILVDAARCPRSPQKRLSSHLGRVYEHLAKGIYAAACDWRPSRFGDLLTYIEPERKDLYLDGPTGVDWIFPNQILHEREETIYVDLVLGDTGRRWAVPRTGDVILVRHGLPFSPSPLGLAQAMKEAGMTSTDALAIIADLWRPIEVREDMEWRQLRAMNIKTIETLEARGALAVLDDERKVFPTIVNEWTYPLHSVDLSLIRVKRGDLEAIQGQWSPDW